MKGFKGTRNDKGRPIGSKNKVDTDIRQAFKNLVENNLSLLDSDIKSLESKDRIKSIVELAKFVLPTLKAIDLKTDKNNFETITFEFGSDT